MGNTHVQELREASHSNAESIRNLAAVLHRVSNDLVETKTRLKNTQTGFDNEREMLLRKIEEQGVVLDKIDAKLKSFSKKTATKKEFTELMNMIAETKNGIIKDKSEIPKIVEETISKERQDWDKVISEMRDRYHETHLGIKDHISLDLEHKRNIQELKKKCDIFEVENHTKSTLGNDHTRHSIASPLDHAESSVKDYKLRVSNISSLMKQLREELRVTST